MKRKILLYLFVLIFCSQATAQIQFNYPARFAKFTTGLHHRSWTLEQNGEETEIAETVFPLSTASQLTDNLSLLFYTAHANAILNSDQNLQGTVDGKLKAFYQIIPHKLLLNLGCTLPYGKNKFTATEFEVADYLFEQILGFGVNRFGEGFDFDFGVSGAIPLGRHLNAGAGLGYLAKGEFEYLESARQKYQPGNEFTLTVGLDFKRDSLFVRGDILTKFYSSDKLAGDDFFQQGTQVEFSSLTQLNAFPLRWQLSGHYVWKNDNEFFQTLNLLPVEGANFIQNSFFGKLNIFYNLKVPVAVSGEFGLHYFGKSELQLGNASIFTIGGGVQYKFSEQVLASLKLKYLTGTAQEGDLAMSGWDSSLAIHFRY